MFANMANANLTIRLGGEMNRAIRMLQGRLYIKLFQCTDNSEYMYQVS